MNKGISINRREANIVIVLGIVITIGFILACAMPPKQIQYKTITSFDLIDGSQTRQTKEGITIELKPVDTTIELKKTKYVGKFRVRYRPFLADKDVMDEKEHKINFFNGLLPFEVTIVNKTDHILRMRDSRVAYIDPGSDEPIMALDKGKIFEDMEVLPVYNEVRTFLVKKYSPKNDIDASIEKALKKIVKKVKFVNSFNREIMPDMRYTGLIVFPIAPAEASEGKVSFIDMVSKTDKAGTPVERVRFDYRVKPISKYYKYDPLKDSSWTQIDKSEYGVPRPRLQ